MDNLLSANGVGPIEAASKMGSSEQSMAQTKKV
jgi:hypothetical protein